LVLDVVQLCSIHSISCSVPSAMPPLAGNNSSLLQEALDVYRARLDQRNFELHMLEDTLSTLQARWERLYSSVSPIALQ
jgi:hypothetical protein